MTLKNQLKIVQKNLGKDFYNHNISQENKKGSILFSLVGMIFNRKQLGYKQHLYIGTRGIALLETKASSNIVSNSNIIYFKDFSQITIEKKIVEHLIVTANNSAVLDINKKQTKDYEKIKNILLEQYEIYQITNKKKVHIYSKNNKRLINIVVAILLLVVFVTIIQIAQYFGYDTEPDRTRSWIYMIEKQKEQETQRSTEDIARDVIANDSI